MVATVAPGVDFWELDQSMLAALWAAHMDRVRERQVSTAMLGQLYASAHGVKDAKAAQFLPWPERESELEQAPQVHGVDVLRDWVRMHNRRIGHSPRS